MPPENKRSDSFESALLSAVDRQTENIVHELKAHRTDLRWILAAFLVLIAFLVAIIAEQKGVSTADAADAASKIYKP